MSDDWSFCPILKIGRRKTLIILTLTKMSVVVDVLGAALVACCEPVCSCRDGIWELICKNE